MTGGRLHALRARLRRDQWGVTALEFAVAGPVLIVLLMGIFDIGHMAYVSAVLHGAVEESAVSYTHLTLPTIYSV